MDCEFRLFLPARGNLEVLKTFFIFNPNNQT